MISITETDGILIKVTTDDKGQQTAWTTALWKCQFISQFFFYVFLGDPQVLTPRLITIQALALPFLYLFI